MRPKLRHYVYWQATEAGALFRGISGTVQIRGDSLAPWVRRLVRMLDGSRTWEARMKGRPQVEIALWERLLQPLLTAGFVVDLDQEEPDGLSQAERERYQTVIAFLGELTDSPAARFERFRRTPVYLRAEGLQGAIALRALVETGVAEIAYQADPTAATLIDLYLAPYQDWPVQLRPVEGEESLGAAGALLWTGEADGAAYQEAAEAAARAGIPLLTTGVGPTARLPLAALGGCHLAHAWLAQATGLPPIAPVGTLEEVMTDVQAGREEGPSVRPIQELEEVERPAVAQG